MCLPVMALTAYINRRRLIHEKEIVGCMGRMACGAFTFSHRGVRSLRSLLPGNGVGVTTAAQGKHRLL